MNKSNYWYIRLLTGRGARPLFVGLAAGAALLLIHVILLAIIYFQDGGTSFSLVSLGINVTAIAVMSYFIGITVHTLEMTQRDVLALAPALALDEESLAREAATITEQSSAIHIWSLCWILASLVVTWWTFQLAVAGNALAIELSKPSFAGWPYFRNLFYMFTLSQFVWIDVALARRLGKLLDKHGKINLLDRSGLRPLAQRARRSVLIWIPLLVVTSTFFVVLLAVVILPVMGIRRRFVEEKDKQLEKVRARIAERSATVVDGSVTSESSNLPELVAWEQRLQQAKVWPYDMTVYLRVFLYASIGLASWIGAALVERFMSAYFG